MKKIHPLIALLCLAATLILPPAQPAMTQAPPPVLLRLRAGDFDPLATPRPAARARPANEADLHLIQFPGPIQDDGYAALEAAGLRVVAYVPDYAYLVWGTTPQLEQAQMAASARWSGPYHPYDALHPTLHAPAPAAVVNVKVQIYAHPAVSDTLAAIAARAQVLQPPAPVLHYRHLAVHIAAADLGWLAALPGVVNVEPLRLPQPHDEIQGQLLAGHLTADGARPAGPGYLAWLTDTLGFPTAPAAYPIVDITDDGVDDGDDTPNHPDFYELGDSTHPDRLAYNLNWTNDATADGIGGHGNLNASIVGGYNAQSGAAYADADGYRYGLGINPFGRVAGSKVFANAGTWEYPEASYAPLLNASYDHGARIASNSWGAPTEGAYTLDDQEYDALVRDAQPNIPGNQEMLIVFSAGNDGADAGSTSSPANAKNIISVGAAESYRPTWQDGCGIGPTGADNAHDIAAFSSRGPTSDGRVKPDLVAPGAHIQGAAAQTAGYVGDGVCDAYHPAGQTLYAASSGTSHAAPAVAGAASLLTWYYQEHVAPAAPGPAMLKAYLMNSARYLSGVGSGDTLPSFSQGFGAVDLSRAFDGAARVAVDQTQVFPATGAAFTLQGGVADPARPFRVTLAWTDAPGATFGAAYVNDLNLTVQVNGQMYLGNVFSGATSTPGGAPDPRNNVESVFLPADASGAFSLTVAAANIAGDGVPGNGDPTDQDFALICYNCALPPDFALTVAPPTQAICAGSNAGFTLTTFPISRFTHPITLSGAGPANVGVAIQPNPVHPGATAQMTLTPTDSIPVGASPLTVTGNTPTRTHTARATLAVYTTLTGAATLLSPTPEQTVAAVQPTFVWSAPAQAQSYRLTIAAAPDLAAPIYTATLPAAGDTVSHTLPFPLAYAAEYAWRVTARNACGAGPASPPIRFHTPPPPAEFCRAPHAAIPDDYAGGVSDALLLPDLGALYDLNVAISVTHSWVGDLAVTLEHSDTGLTTTLLARPGQTATNTVGCGGDDLDILLDDSAADAVGAACRNATPAYPPGGVYRPPTPLGVFHGVSFSGTWRLRVADHATGDDGVLNHWCLIPTAHSAAFTFARPVYTVRKDAGAAAIAVNLQPPAHVTASVAYTTADLTARAGRDYEPVSGVLTFAPGVIMQIFTVPVRADPTNTISRTVQLSLERPVSATFLLPQQAHLHIVAPGRVYLPLILRNALCNETICLPR